MNNKYNYELISIGLQVTEVLIAIYTGIILNNPWIWVVLCLFAVPATAFVFVWFRYKKLSDYVSFIEYLNSNGKHDFGMLPLLRMYIHKNRIINDLEITLAEISYIVSPLSNDKSENNSEVIYGDATINYKFTIVNKKLPDTYNFIILTDPSGYAPEIKYRIGNYSDYSEVHGNELKLSPYWDGKMKHVSIGLDKTRITQNETLSLDIEVRSKSMFIFKRNNRDTVICLPMLYGSTVKRMIVQIDLSAFGDDTFYCNARRIHSNNQGFIIDEIACKTKQAKNVYEYEMSIDSSHENAYYFRPGFSEFDPDDISK